MLSLMTRSVITILHPFTDWIILSVQRFKINKRHLQSMDLVHVWNLIGLGVIDQRRNWSCVRHYFRSSIESFLNIASNPSLNNLLCLSTCQTIKHLSPIVSCIFKLRLEGTEFPRPHYIMPSLPCKLLKISLRQVIIQSRYLFTPPCRGV